ncbi:TPA: hypothetical protein ACS8CD_000293 [Providencia alcalifaciens]
MSLELAIKENTEVMRQLIAAMQSGAVVQTKVTLQPNEKPQPTKAETKTATDKKESAKTETKVTDEPVDLSALNLGHIVAHAVMFKGSFNEITGPQLKKINNALAEIGDKRNGQIDALYVTLANLKEVAGLPSETIHDLCLEMLENWDQITGITERSEFALSLLSEGKTTSKEPENVDPNVLFEQAEKLILQLAKGGYRNEAVEILTKFDAKKLGQVPEDKLAEVIELAKKVLEG